MPNDDADYSTRWRLIKSEFSRNCPLQYKQNISPSRRRKKEQAIWQRRFWEHQIQDEKDLNNHIEYIHYNPVKHGLVNAPKHWQYSSFHRYVKDGIYSEDWGANGKLDFNNYVGGE